MSAELHVIQPEDVRPLTRAAAADQAPVLAPTHVLRQGDAIVGYGSAGQMALVHGWTAGTVTDAEALQAFRLVEMAAMLHGAKYLAVVCTDDCRFKPYMVQEGYHEGHHGTVYLKKVS
jgi:hypothetical protein